MRRLHFAAFTPRCPVCHAAGRPAAPLTVAGADAADADDLRNAILHCPALACRHEFPVINGIPLVLAGLRQLLTDRGVELLLRDDLPAEIESLLGDAIGPDSWFDMLRQMLSTYGWDAYAALDPAEAPADGHGPVPGAAARLVDMLLDAAAPAAPVQRVLDLGCGAGASSFALAARLPTARVLGCDLHPGLLRLAQAAASGHVTYPRRRIGLVYDRRAFPVALEGAGRVDFWAADATAMPLADGVADLIVALNLFDCLPDPLALLREAARLAAPERRARRLRPVVEPARIAAP